MLIELVKMVKAHLFTSFTSILKIKKLRSYSINEETQVLQGFDHGNYKHFSELSFSVKETLFKDFNN